MLDQLLKIKRLREDDAIKKVAEAQAALERTISVRDDRKRAHSKFEQWRIREEDRRYQAVHRRNVGRGKIEELREQIGAWRKRDLQLLEEYHKAVRDVDTARTTVEDAKARRMNAYREVRKYEEYAEVIAEEARLSAERRSEGEAEEFVVRRV